MKIEEAIEIKKRQKEGYTTYSKKVIDEADGLSIEALKGIQKVRKTLRPYVEALLPGETEE